MNFSQSKSLIERTQSEKFRQVLRIIERTKNANVPILILGETGTGKELIARLIHSKSRQNRIFVDINCSAVPESLLESEFFGHKKGAFTGANQTKIGLIEQANNGTLFLDEIGYMSREAQAILLKAIETKSFRRVGALDEIKSEFRLICATNVDIINSDVFRKDLLYRIGVIKIELPPLRERKEDIPHLIDHYIKKFCFEFQRMPPEITQSAIAQLVNYDWPGNIRELKNVICQSLLMSNGKIDEILLDNRKTNEIKLDEPTQGNEINTYQNNINEILDLKKLEKAAILKALISANWIQKEAARLLNISSRALNYKILSYKITSSTWRVNK
jgi:transcriptional regulator with PAS, ATPase and Fis domain